MTVSPTSLAHLTNGGWNARALMLVIRAFCLLPVITGLMDMLTGVRPLTAVGARIPPDVAADATLNSQIAFWGAIWFGYGFFLWWAAGEVKQRAAPMRIALAILFLSGVARGYAALRFGMPPPPLMGAMALELLAAPLLLLWHRKIVEVP